MSKVIKFPEIIDPPVIVGETDPPGGTDASDVGAENIGEAGDLDDEFLVEYGQDLAEEEPEDPGPPPHPLAEERAELVRRADEERDRARDEGHREGVAAAEAEMAEKLQAIEERLQRWSDLVDGVEGDFQTALSDLSQQAVELCLAVGEKLALRTLRDDGGTLAGLFTAAIDRAAADSKLRILLNPEDKAMLADEWEAITGFRNGDLEIELVEDAGITRGGCMIEAGGGRVDATVENRLDSVRLAVSPPKSGEAAVAAPD